MYDPRKPNRYSDLVRARQEKKRQDADEAAAEVKAAASAAPLDDDSEQLARMTSELSCSIVDITPAELRRHRISVSATLGNGLAMQIEREEHDAALRERKSLGIDGKNRGNKFLQKMGVAEGSGLGRDGGGLKSHLVLEPSRLAAGGSVLAPGTNASAPPAVAGRPSMTLLLRNVATKGEDTEQLKHDVQLECSQQGVVKAVRVHVLEPVPENWSEGEAVRVLVKFDSVAAAIKASNALNGSPFRGRRLVVCFFPFQSFEKGDYTPQPDEVRLP